jgi:hypothetical protein
VQRQGWSFLLLLFIFIFYGFSLWGGQGGSNMEEGAALRAAACGVSTQRAQREVSAHTRAGAPLRDGFAGGDDGRYDDDAATHAAD